MWTASANEGDIALCQYIVDEHLIPCGSVNRLSGVSTAHSVQHPAYTNMQTFPGNTIVTYKKVTGFFFYYFTFSLGV